MGAFARPRPSERIADGRGRRWASLYRGCRRRETAAAMARMAQLLVGDESGDLAVADRCSSNSGVYGLIFVVNPLPSPASAPCRLAFSWW